MVRMYSLSTCPWCKKMKRFLKDEGIDFEFVDLDVADEEEKAEAFREMADLGLSPAFPITIVAGEAVQGYHPDRVRELVGDAVE